METRLRKGNILIVDDTPENLSVLLQMLTEQGYRVRPALSGEIALKSVQTDPPDLILLDILMPEMDGYEVCSVLNSNERTAQILDGGGQILMQHRMVAVVVGLRRHGEVTTSDLGDDLHRFQALPSSAPRGLSGRRLDTVSCAFRRRSSSNQRCSRCAAG